MGSWFPLAIFPEGALASSVVTTVLVGVWVVVFFNLRFGWVLSGLVVPGYLAPLIMLEPVSAAVIALEAVVTYGIVRLLSIYLADAIGWTTFFGRDRFFALILVSVVVRLLFDEVLLPPVAVWLNANYDLGFDWTRDLEGFGLIVIALFANQFWKTGLVRGLMTSLTCIGITLVIVRFGLMEFTNFRLSDIGYLYELLAASLVASSKAYIILILTAFLASRLNLRAGLDFNGLLIPALVALQWYEPMKILTSILEALVILLIGSLLLRLPYFADKTIEGGRKILLFFNVSFAWKMLVGYVVLWADLDIITSDAYGFGYLLSSLLAVKLHDKGEGTRMLTALVTVSAQGAAIGTIVGFVFSEGSRAMAPVVEAPAEAAPERDALSRELLASAVQRSTYAETAGAAPRPDVVALQGFREGLATILSDLAPDGGNLTELVEARRKIAVAGYSTRMTDAGNVVIEPVVNFTGRAVFVIDPRSDSALTISLADATAARGLSSAASALFEATDARAMILRGAAGGTAEGEVASYFHAAHDVLGGAILQLTASGEVTQPTLEVVGRYPRSVDLPRLEALIGDVALVTGTAARSSQQRYTARAGFGLLDLTPDAIHAIVARIEGGDIFLDPGPGGTPGTIRDRVIGNAAAPEAAPPDIADLLYLESELLAPLFDEALPRMRAEPMLDRQTTDLLVSLDVAARSLDYRLGVMRDPTGAARNVILYSDRVSWGTFVLRVDETDPVFVHVPTGLRDRRILNLGLSIYGALDASAMMIAGRVDRDGLPAPDLAVLNPDHVPGLYDLISKLSIQRDAAESVTLVLRSVSDETLAVAPDVDVIVSPDSILGDQSTSGLTAQTISDLRDFGFSVAQRRGTEVFAGFEPGVIPQAGFLSARPLAEFVSLWLSPDLLNQFADHSGRSAQMALFRRLGATMATGPLAAEAQRCIAPGRLSGTVTSDLRAYLDSGNPVALQSLLRREGGLSATHLSDPATQQAFALLEDAATGCLRAVVNLNPLGGALLAPGTLAVSEVSRTTLADFAISRRALLTFREDARP